MEYLELAKFIKEVGISIGVFILCFWIVQYIIKKMGSSLDSMIGKMDIFTARVRKEHEQSAEQHKQIMSDNKEAHKAIMEEHTEIIRTLGRINGYKE